MKVEVNVPRTWAYVVLIGLLLGSGMFAFVMAYNTNYGTTPQQISRDGNDVATKVGHSPDEIEVSITGTAPCNGKMTLKAAIDNNCLGGSTTPTSSPGVSCQREGGIWTGTAPADTLTTVTFASPFATGITPIVTVTPDISDSPASTSANLVIREITESGFKFRSIQPLKRLHYVAQEPKCFTPQGIANDVGCGGGYTEGDCYESGSGSYTCKSGKWVYSGGTHCF